MASVVFFSPLFFFLFRAVLFMKAPVYFESDGSSRLEEEEEEEEEFGTADIWQGL